MDIDNFVIDFSDIPDPEPIPEGIYRAEITHAEPGESKAGHAKIEIRWKIMSGEYENRVIFDGVSFHPNAARIAKIKLRNMGVPKDFSGGLQDISELILGCVADISVVIQSSTEEDEQGDPYPDRNNVRKISPVQASVGDLLGKGKKGK